MPAYDFEVAFVRNEGVEFRLLAQPVELLGEDGKVTGLRCVRMELGPAGSDGRRRVTPVPGSEFVLPCDQVIKAIGQSKLAPLFEAFGVDTEHGYVKVDERLRTSNPKVFAGGDCVRLSGHALTVTAAQDGKIAAQGIAEALGVAPLGRELPRGVSRSGAGRAGREHSDAFVPPRKGEGAAAHGGRDG